MDGGTVECDPGLGSQNEGGKEGTGVGGRSSG